MRFTFIIYLLFAMGLSISTSATEQVPDRLIIKGDTLRLHALPLEVWEEFKKLKEPLFPDSLNSFSTGCWRGYIAYWEVIDDRLYLNSIYNEEKTAKVDIKSLFRNQLVDGRIPADWFSDTVTAYKGKLISYMHAGFSSIFEHEYEYTFENGRLKNIEYFDNSMSKNIPFVMGELNVRAETDALIDWNALPPIEESIYVFLQVRGNELGYVDSIVHMNGKFEVFNQEAIRVTRLLKRIPVIYSRGKMQPPEICSLYIVFTREKQEKFRK
ncbi:hypothetical protein GQF61_02055 [Sphingobacterium sp. DK4209]|uniref:TonB C-terminal domain-containing protein n=1 Tax=Sphingobacterium zhuxiongii TaxID=2662364 RepID=A0A5Q0QCM3_9SPHI|nr:MULTISPECIES: hypothetical protein [unclassified Sphingobacterium]MVZ64620.1 hypothetical protein [Sphingobacterium sp. DK4209]QGA26959.1 hypothetical protein GFH32_11810 [Sphingobacterium sp. dk4302]